MADFDDLLAANQTYAETFESGGFDGVAHAGVAIVTCMDSRIEPLAMLGLSLGDAKIFRNPGGRVTPQAMEALVLGVHLLNVKRILIVPHTRCAVASNTEAVLRSKLGESAGQGFLHDFAGLTMFAAALFCVFVIDSLFTRLLHLRTARARP